jgi:hypothetical protein
MQNTKPQAITPRIIEEAMSYEAYRSLIDEKLEQDKTTGTMHFEGAVEYTRQNVELMNRLDETVEINGSLKN